MQDEITKESIEDMSAKDLLDERFVSGLLELGADGNQIDLVMREQLYGYAQIRARELQIKSAFDGMYKAAKRAVDAAQKEAREKKKREAQAEKVLSQAVEEGDIPEWQKKILRKASGVWTDATENFLLVLQNDDYFSGLKFNLLSNSPEKWHKDGTVTRWVDADDAEMRMYIETTYGIHSVQKLDDAFRQRCRQTEYHPIRDYIDSLQWDGTDRIEQFFQFAVKAKDTPYVREASRLLFAGGIQRLYNPGCKFDEMVVLIGTKQGEGKSTLVKWLAIRDEWFGEISEIEGQRGIEALEGKWILEFAELLAMVRAKEAEAQKAYITRQCDRYRHPFDKRVSEHKRQCIFVGTTNKAQFLTDKTGNRRYIPLRIIQSGKELYAREAEVREYIEQCWAEALAKINTPFMQPFIDVNKIDEVRTEQENATEDDYREGLISNYVDENGITEVSVIEIWEKALHADEEHPKKPQKKDSMDIALMLTALGFERAPGKKRFGAYGNQRYFFRKYAQNNTSQIDSEYPPF